ncbi:MAG TPA: hypothetical protein VK738_17785 [Terriglobales bacterium]|jgi:hypothetical protein|nr:hypothetical protein [Terriglobales bacterium]
MPDLQRFIVFMAAGFVLFLAVLLWVLHSRSAKPRRLSLLMLATVVVPAGMTFAWYSHHFFPDLSWAIYYGVPALTTFVLPPLWLHMSRQEITRYVPMAVCMAPAIHIVFSLLVGWHDYMPFPIYIPSLAELARRIA